MTKRKNKPARETETATTSAGVPMQSEDDRLREEKDVLLWQLRNAEAELWGAVDKFTRVYVGLLTGDAQDPAALKVKARSATGALIVYDDGATYFTARRLGGLNFRPLVLEFEHSNPAVPGSVVDAIKFRTHGN